MAQCDTHGKISKHVDEEFVRDIQNRQKETVEKVTSVNSGIRSILEAEGEIPLWEEIMEL